MGRGGESELGRGWGGSDTILYFSILAYSAALVELFLHLLGINVAEIAYAADVAQLE